jgi:hypothetical protein
VSYVRKALRPLLERSILVPERSDSDALEGRQRSNSDLILSDWADHNPTRTEVEEYTSERSLSGTKGNHKRWHEARNVVDPDCEWCRSSDPPSDRSSDPTAIADRSHGMGWDRREEQSSETTTGESLSDPDDDQAMALARRELALREAELGPVGNPDGWLRSVAAGHRTKADADPNYLDRAQAARTPTARQSPLDGTLAAQRAAMERNARRDQGHSCSHCDDTGWIETNDNNPDDVTRCDWQHHSTPPIQTLKQHHRSKESHSQ